MTSNGCWRSLEDHDELGVAVRDVQCAPAQSVGRLQLLERRHPGWGPHHLQGYLNYKKVHPPRTALQAHGVLGGS